MHIKSVNSYVASPLYRQEGVRAHHNNALSYRALPVHSPRHASIIKKRGNGRSFLLKVNGFFPLRLK